MSRLHEKGLLDRHEELRPYSYLAAVARDEYSAELMIDVLAKVGNRKAALAKFVERIGRRDAALLVELAKKAKGRRR